MSERKQYPYRYNEEMENLLEKGLEMYKNESPTPKFSLNQLLDLCIKIAVEICPKRVKEFSNENEKLKKQIEKLETEKEKAISDLAELKNLIKTKYQVDGKIQKLIKIT